jgi:hypothetical protein
VPLATAVVRCDPVVRGLDVAPVSPRGAKREGASEPPGRVVLRQSGALGVLIDLGNHRSLPQSSPSHG